VEAAELAEEQSKVRPIETTPDARTIAAWHAVRAAAWQADRPAEPVPTGQETARDLTGPVPGVRTARWLVEDATGTALGFAALRLHSEDAAGAAGVAGVGEAPGHVAELDLQVHPGHRRHGHGSALLAAALQTARAAGSRTLLAGAPDGSPGAAFLAARGFTRALGIVQLRLDIPALDQDALRATVRAGSPGYRLARWQGVVPSDLAESYAAARSAMDNRPMTGLARGTAAWEVEHLHRMAEVVRERGDALLTVAALSDGPDGHEEVAGYSEIVVPGGENARAQTYSTAVVPAHRGHGLGTWVKAAMLQWLLGAHPEVREVWTDCAEENHHMLAVNTELGFEEARRESHYSLDLQAPPQGREAVTSRGSSPRPTGAREVLPAGRAQPAAP
jgi:GNAT superfamily N-acetyltransferase